MRAHTEPSRVTMLHRVRSEPGAYLLIAQRKASGWGRALSSGLGTDGQEMGPVLPSLAQREASGCGRPLSSEPGTDGQELGPVRKLRVRTCARLPNPPPYHVFTSCTMVQRWTDRGDRTRNWRTRRSSVTCSCHVTVVTSRPAVLAGVQPPRPACTTCDSAQLVP